MLYFVSLKKYWDFDGMDITLYKVIEFPIKTPDICDKPSHGFWVHVNKQGIMQVPFLMELW